MTGLWIVLGILVLGVIIALVSPIKFRALLTPAIQQLSVRYLLFGFTVDLAQQRQTVDVLGLKIRSFTARLGEKPEKKKEPGEEEKPKVKEPPKEEAKKLPVPRIVEALWRHRKTIKRIILRALRLLARLPATPQLRLLKIEVTAGTGDPALTGMYYGWYHAIQPAWAARRVFVTWYPVFEKAYITASLDGRLWLQPWRPLWETVRFVIALPKRGLFRLYKEIKQKEA